MTGIRTDLAQIKKTELELEKIKLEIQKARIDIEKTNTDLHRLSSLIHNPSDEQVLGLGLRKDFYRRIEAGQEKRLPR